MDRYLVMVSTWNELNLKPMYHSINQFIATCLVLAAKVTDAKELNYHALLENISRIVEVSSKDVLAQEFPTYASLDFSLFLSPIEVMPHLERIMMNICEFLQFSSSRHRNASIHINSFVSSLIDHSNGSRRYLWRNFVLLGT